MSSNPDQNRGLVPTILTGTLLLIIALVIWNRDADEEARVDPAGASQATDQPKRGASPRRAEDAFEQLRDQFQVNPETTEALRARRWRDQFPWQPTHDPAVKITREILDSPYLEPEVANHGFLKAFFENEARFTPQFELLYRILAEYDRADNPVLVGKIFESLWLYHKHARDEKAGVPRRKPEPGRFHDPENHFSAAGESENIVSILMLPRNSPDKPLLREAEAGAIRDRILAEIDGMDSIPRRPLFAYHGNYEDELQVGDSPLTPYPGWQKAYDLWEAEHEADLEKAIAMGILDPARVGRSAPASSKPAGIGADGELLDQNGKPILASELPGLLGGLVGPDGRQLPLRIDEHNRIIVPSPSEFEGPSEFE